MIESKKLRLLTAGFSTLARTGDEHAVSAGMRISRANLDHLDRPSLTVSDKQSE